MDTYVDFLRNSSTFDVDKIKFDMEDTNLKMTCPAFGGHLMATIICPRFRPCMATVRPGVMKKAAFDQAKADACEIIKPSFALSADDLDTQVVEVVKAAKKLVDLIGADVVVSVGRGISKDVEGGIKLAEELAEVLGGVVGASRAVVDLAGCLLTTRSARPARPCTPRSMLLWASPAPSSTRPACRIPSASLPSIRTTPPPFSRSRTTASAATCSRSLPCSSMPSRLPRLRSNIFSGRSAGCSL